MKINKDQYTIRLQDNSVLVCNIRGNIRKSDIKCTVGDNVLVNSKTLTIEEILERKNTLERPLVSNIDKLIIVCSTHIPVFSSYLLDKFLVISLSNKIEPVIILTKIDKLNRIEKKDIKYYYKYYKKLGYKVYYNYEIKKIKKEIKNNIVALTGQTGAGKSTLINKINPSLNLDTNEISKSLGRGKHTTRLVELIPLYDGLIADTPGFSALEININKEELKKYFIEFNNNCKYKRCLHIKENGCEVLKQLNSKKISEFRYENYTKLLKEAK